MIKIEFPAENKLLAGAIGRALSEYASGGVRKVERCTVEEAVSLATDVPAHMLTNEEGSDAGETGNDPTRNAEAVTGQASSTGTSAGATASANTETRVDTNGVPFSDEFCGEAKVPFYASGPHKGQWKKRKGVSEEDYNSWYANALTAAGNNPAATKEDTPLDTAGAFGNNQNAATDQVKAAAPKDCGEFMGWVSGQQAAGLLNQIDITDAYATLNLQVTDLFPPNDAATISRNVANLYAVLGGLE